MKYQVDKIENGFILRVLFGEGYSWWVSSPKELPELMERIGSFKDEELLNEDVRKKITG